MFSVLAKAAVCLSALAVVVPAAAVSAQAMPAARSAAPHTVVKTDTSAAASDVVAAAELAPARSQDLEPTELVGERSATSKTFLRPDGSKQTEVFTSPVHYRAGDGDWATIDSTLVESGQPGYAVENDANDYRLLIPTDAGAQPVRFQTGGEWVSFAAQGADGAPQVQGSTASIGGLGRDTRLEYEATSQGVKEMFILEEAPTDDAASSWTFDLDTSAGLTPRLAADGGLDFVEQNGDVAFVVPAPFMTDSSGTDAGYSDAVSFDLTQAGDAWQLTLAADPEWLADPARVFPVRVDPTITANGAFRDCWINQFSPNTPNCGAGSDWIRAGWSGGDARRSLLEFNLDSIPVNATGISADLGLYVDNTQTTNVATATYVARRMTRSWTGLATWNNYNGTNPWTTPGGDFTVSGAAGTNINGATSGYRNIDASPMTSAWVRGTEPNHGMVVKQQPENVNSILGFFSSDSANSARWPKLTVTYTEPTPPVFDGIGERRFFTFDEQQLNDRMAAKVNVGNGNLLLAETDLNIAGTGIDAGVQRFYNSLATNSTDPAKLGPGWVLGDSPTVRLEFPSANRVIFVGPTGYRARFDRNAAGDFLRADPGLDAALSFDSGSNTYRLDWFSKDRMVFDTAGKMTRSEDKQGNAISYTYNGSGDLDFFTDTQGREVDFTYASGLLDTITDEAGGRTYDYNYAQFHGDPEYRLADFAVTSYGLGSDTVNLNQETRFDYDSDGRLIEVTDPEGHDTRLTYDDDSNRIETIQRRDDDGPDPTTTFTYSGSDDQCDNPATEGVTEVNGPRTDVSDLTTYCVDEFDRVIDTIDAKGHPRASTYTANSNVEDFNDSGGTGQPYAFGWSADDNLESVGLPSGGESTAAYGDATSPHFPTAVRDFATADASAATWAYDYDPKGNLIEAANSTEGITFRYCYNALGLLQRIDAPPNTTALDNSTTADCGTANQGNDTLFFYDTPGNLIEIDKPGPHGDQTFTYDAVSRVETMTDGRGVVTTNSYDALDRTTEQAYDDPTDAIPGVASIDYNFDADGNLVNRDDATGDTDFTFDDLNRMTREAPDEHGESVSYTYDTAGNMLTLDDSEQPNSVRYAYNNVNLTTSVIDQRNRTTSFAYNTRDMRTSTVYPNGVTQKQEFDESGRMTCIYGYTGTPPSVGGDGCPNPSTSLLTFFSYDYTAPGGRDTKTRYAEADRNNHTTAYTYDDITRLERARTTTSGGSEVRDYEYLMEARGNITRETVSGSAVPNTTRSFAYNENSELCWVASGTHSSTCGTVPSGATTYNYDDAGNLESSSDGLDAGYNLQGQTATIEPPGAGEFAMAYAGSTSDLRTEFDETRFTYNLLGLGTQGENSGTDQDTWFVRDPQGTLVSLVNDDTGDDDQFYLFDGLGSVVATTDEGGALVTRYTYEPYGEQISPDPSLTSGGEPVDKNPWRYAAGYYDTPTGMLKYGTRYYMPDLMRWTQPDPEAGNANDPMSLNAYSYVGCDPINSVDPTGRLSEEDFNDVVGAIGSCVGGGAAIAAFVAEHEAYIAALAVAAGLGSVTLAPLTVVWGSFAAGCIAGVVADLTLGFSPFDYL